MHPEVMKIGALMSLQAPFTVPKYQRGYAWDKEQIRDFVGDVTMLDLNQPAGPHFFGGLVSIRRDEANTPAGVAYEVVDGQQRLTTFVLTLNSIIRGYREVADEALQTDSNDETLARRASTTADIEEETYLKYKHTDDQGNLTTPYKLRLSRIDREFFASYLARQRIHGRRAHSHNLLRRADATIRTTLVDPIVKSDELTVQEKFDQLHELRARITDRCYLVHLVSDDDAEAYQLFAVLNDRGKSLSEAELLRTHTLRLLENFDASQLIVEQQWEPIISSRPVEVVAFLRNYFASRTGSRWPSRGLHDAYVERFFGKVAASNDSEAERVVELVRDLNEEHEKYVVIRRGEWPYDNPQEGLWVRTRLARLIRTLGLDASLPLLLSVASTRDEATFSSVVVVLERFGFRYLVSGGHASEMGDRLYEEAARFRDNDGYASDDLERTCRKLLLKYGRDATFLSGMLNRLQYHTSGTNSLLRYFLTAVEDHYAWLAAGHSGLPRHDPLSVIDVSQVSIEHIYPQRPRADEQVPELAPHLHELGNLSFWGPGENPRAGNLSFDVKRRNHYPQSGVRLTSELAVLDRWAEEELLDRQHRLTEWGLALFQIPEAREADEEVDRQADWLVRHNADSEFGNYETQVFDYQYNDPNAVNIVEGDALVRYLSKREAEDGRRVLGFGRVSELRPDGDLVLAIFDRYVRFDPALTFEELGLNQRMVRGSISRIEDPQVIATLLERAGEGSLDGLPAIELTLDELAQGEEDDDSLSENQSLDE